MLVVIINFPPVKAGKDKEFLEWFDWSNKEFAKHEGFGSRRLLKALKDGSYAAVVEHESEKTFAAMNSSPFHGEAAKRVGPLLEGSPTPNFYEVIAG